MLSPLVGLFYRKHTPSYTMNNSCKVTFGLIGNMSFEVSCKKQDEYGRILNLRCKC